MDHSFHYGTDKLTIGKTFALADGSLKGVIGTKAMEKISASQQAVDRIVSEHTTVYGINTGFRHPLQYTHLGRRYPHSPA